MDVHVQVLYHAPDHGQLLVVLFSEYGQVGLCDIEKLGNHGGNAIKMAGS